MKTGTPKTPKRKPNFWLRVDNARNSVCNSARLADLVWSSWWTDRVGHAFYLHVPHRDGETVHRVYCRRTSSPRLEMRGGVLGWLVDPDAPRADVTDLLGLAALALADRPAPSDGDTPATPDA